MGAQENDKPRILIADDSEPLVEILKKWLEGKYHVIPAYNGQEAIDQYKEYNPYLVLMDIKMPIKTGLTAIEEINEYDNSANIVVITGYPYTEEELGAQVLQKGFSKVDFLEMVERRMTLPR